MLYFHSLTYLIEFYICLYSKKRGTQNKVDEWDMYDTILAKNFKSENEVVAWTKKQHPVIVKLGKKKMNQWDDIIGRAQAWGEATDEAAAAERIQLKDIIMKLVVLLY